MNVLAIEIMLLNPSGDHRPDRILDVIGSTIAESGRTIEAAKACSDTEYYRTIEDNEAEYVEQLIGVALVAAQTYISETVSRVVNIHNTATKPSFRFPTNGTPHEIMTFSNNKVGDPPTHFVLVLNALANYFKHADEWTAWNSLNNLQKQTRDIIQSVGATEYCTGNLRRGVAALGVKDLEDLRPIADTCRSWRAALHSAYRDKYNVHSSA